jgi:radical SAM-linked protein
MACDKFRIRFRKDGDLRFVSHHDLMRCFERMLRRAAIPFQTTQGFNPKPRLAFALSLGLGIVGCREIVDLELNQEMSAEVLCERLSAQAPSGLAIISVTRLDPRARPRVVGLTYRIGLPAEFHNGLADKVAAALASEHLGVDRELPRPRRADLRPWLRSLAIEAGALVMQLWVTTEGTARAEEILDVLGIKSALEQGAVLERTHLELADETMEPASGADDVRSQSAPEDPHHSTITAGARMAAWTSRVALALPESQVEGNS